MLLAKGDLWENRRPWKYLTSEEDRNILEAAEEEAPEISSRQLAVWITDKVGFPCLRIHGVLHFMGAGC